ncbi:hypothetical protein ABPG75_006073 [Micractinium tetrahymenae]
MARTSFHLRLLGLALLCLSATAQSQSAPATFSAAAQLLASLATAGAMPSCIPAGTGAAELAAYFDCIDSSRDGALSFEEACTSALPGCGDAMDNADQALLSQLQAAFSSLDTNADGLLSPAEFDVMLADFLGGAAGGPAPAPAPAMAPIPAPAAAVVQAVAAPLPVAAPSSSAASRTYLFGAAVGVLTALLALIHG